MKKTIITAVAAAVLAASITWKLGEIEAAQREIETQRNEILREQRKEMAEQAYQMLQQNRMLDKVLRPPSLGLPSRVIP